MRSHYGPHRDKSRFIRSVGYDATSGTMEIEFATGNITMYFEVPQEAYEALMNAESISQHFKAHIHGRFSELAS